MKVSGAARGNPSGPLQQVTDKARGTVSHVHGGIGIDNDGEEHRHYVAARHGEFALGGATAQLRRIGACLGTG